MLLGGTSRRRAPTAQLLVLLRGCAPRGAGRGGRRALWHWLSMHLTTNPVPDLFNGCRLTVTQKRASRRARDHEAHDADRRHTETAPDSADDSDPAG